MPARLAPPDEPTATIPTRAAFVSVTGTEVGDTTAARAVAALLISPITAAVSVVEYVTAGADAVVAERADVVGTAERADVARPDETGVAERADVVGIAERADTARSVVVTLRVVVVVAERADVAREPVDIVAERADVVGVAERAEMVRSVVARPPNVGIPERADVVEIARTPPAVVAERADAVGVVG